MRVMARICFDDRTAEYAAAVLRAHGYKVLLSSFRDEPGYVFAEATCECAG